MDGDISLSAVYNNPSFPEFGRPCDTHLKVDDGSEFKVYSKLLSKNSEFFKSLFCCEEAVGHSVVIHGINPNIFEKVLVYLYTSYVSLNTKNMLDLLVAADFLLIEPLLLKCRRFVEKNINQENCVAIFLTAHRIKESHLKEESCLDISLHCQNATRLPNNSMWCNPRNYMKYFLSHKCINEAEEKAIWSYVDEKVREIKFGFNRLTSQKIEIQINQPTSRSIYAVYNNPAFPEFGRPCDTHLKTDDGAEFKAYSEYLSNNSEFFKSLFLNGEAKGQSVVIHGIKSDTLERVLIYLHTRQVSINTKNMLDLLVASDFLRIEPLLLECERFASKNISQENCINIFLAAYQIKATKLKDKSLRFILIRFEKAVKLSRNRAYDLPYDSVKYLLSNRSLNASEERVVWSFIEGWVKRDKSKRLSTVPQLLRHLCVNAIDNKLAHAIITSPIIRQNELYKDLGDPRLTLHPLSDRQKALKIIGGGAPSSANRQPRSVYFVAKASLQNDLVEMYVTYDHRLDFWRRVGSRPFSLHTLLGVGCRIYVFKSYKYAPKFIEEGGWVYDLTTNKISPMAAIPSTNQNPLFFLALEASGRIYALQIGYAQATLQRYVDATDEWTSLAPMPDPVMLPTAAATLDGRVYVVGRAATRVYDPTSDAWDTVATPNMERLDMLSAEYGGRIFLIGGFSDDGKLLKEVEVYDPDVDEWSVYPDVPFGCSVSDSGVGVLEGRMFVYRKSPPYSVAYWWDGEWGLVEDERSPLLRMRLYSFCVVDGDEAVGKIAEINRAVEAGKWVESGLGEERLLKSND